MKSFKYLAASCLALAIAGTASAVPTIIRYTGSTAYRAAAQRSIIDILGPITGATTVLVGQNGTSMDKSNTSVFVGRVGGNDVIVETAWTGSVGGVQVIATTPAVNSALPYYNDPVDTGGGVWKVDGITLLTPDASGNGANLSSLTPTHAHIADIGLSDVSPAVAGYVGGSFASLNSTKVGVVPFAWAGAGYSDDNGATTHAGLPPGFLNGNISRSAALSLISGGVVAASQITSNSADAYPVFMVGRDHDSGTRAGYILTTQYSSTIYDGTVVQYIANQGSAGADSVGSTQFDPQTVGTGLITSLDPWPTETVLGTSFGSEGWFTGGNVKAELNRPCDLNAAGYIVSQLGTSDQSGVNPDAGYTFTDFAGRGAHVTQSQNALTYNGQYPGSSTHHFGPPYTNVIEGQYEDWGYEFNFWLHSHDTALAGGPDVVAQFGASFRSKLISQADYEGVGIRLVDMHCTRVEGGAITHN